MNALGPLSGIKRAVWLHELDARACLISVFLFALFVVSLKSVFTLGLALVVSLLLMANSGIAIKVFLKRLVSLQVFLILVVGFLPFTLQAEHAAGHLFGLFPYYDPGIERAQEIYLRVNSIAMVSLVFIATLLPEQVGHALFRLGVSPKLVQLFLMTVRYVSVISKEYQRLRLAMKARAFQPGTNLHTWRSYGWLMGMLLVRSLERADRVVKAMKCRGYDGQYMVIEDTNWKKTDSVFVICTFALLSVLWIVESNDFRFGL